MGTKMCRISVRTTLVFTPKVGIPEFLVLFLKKIQIGENWFPWAPGPGPGLGPGPGPGPGPGGPWGALGGPWALALGPGPGPGPVAYLGPILALFEACPISPS